MAYFIDFVWSSGFKRHARVLKISNGWYCSMHFIKPIWNAALVWCSQLRARTGVLLEYASIATYNLNIIATSAGKSSCKIDLSTLSQAQLDNTERHGYSLITELTTKIGCFDHVHNTKLQCFVFWTMQGQVLQLRTRCSCKERMPCIMPSAIFKISFSFWSPTDK